MVGQVVTPGEPLASLELSGDEHDLRALLYMPPDKGKQIKTGMRVRLSPRTVKREEYGFMYATVSQVAEFPSSPKGMLRLLENQALVEQFSSEGAPITVFAELEKDPTTPSGFKWSSPQGPPGRVFSGTFCNGSVEIRTQAPISLVVPYLKHKLGLD